MMISGRHIRYTHTHAHTDRTSIKVLIRVYIVRYVACAPRTHQLQYYNYMDSIIISCIVGGKLQTILVYNY